MATKKKAAKKPAAKKPAKKAAAKKPAAKKPAAKKPAAKKAAAPKAAKKPAAKKRKLNPALAKPLAPSAILAAIVGDKPLPRTEAVKRVWDYIKKYNLQDKVNRRMINADEKLKALFGKAQLSMFDMAKAISKNLK